MNLKNFPQKLNSKTSCLRITVPENLDLALEGLIRKVLREQPKTDDIYTFAANYFETLLRLRDKAESKHPPDQVCPFHNDEEAHEMFKLANTFPKPIGEKVVVPKVVRKTKNSSGKLPKKQSKKSTLKTKDETITNKENINPEIKKQTTEEEKNEASVSTELDVSKPKNILETNPEAAVFPKLVDKIENPEADEEEFLKSDPIKELVEKELMEEAEKKTKTEAVNESKVNTATNEISENSVTKSEDKKEIEVETNAEELCMVVDTLSIPPKVESVEEKETPINEMKEEKDEKQDLEDFTKSDIIAVKEEEKQTQADNKSEVEADVEKTEVNLEDQKDGKINSEEPPIDETKSVKEEIKNVQIENEEISPKAEETAENAKIEAEDQEKDEVVEKENSEAPTVDAKVVQNTVTKETQKEELKEVQNDSDTENKVEVQDKITEHQEKVEESTENGQNEGAGDETAEGRESVVERIENDGKLEETEKSESGTDRLDNLPDDPESSDKKLSSAVEDDKIVKEAKTKDEAKSSEVIGNDDKIKSKILENTVDDSEACSNDVKPESIKTEDKQVESLQKEDKPGASTEEIPEKDLETTDAKVEKPVIQDEKETEVEAKTSMDVSEAENPDDLKEATDGTATEGIKEEKETFDSESKPTNVLVDKSQSLELESSKTDEANENVEATKSSTLNEDVKKNEKEDKSLETMPDVGSNKLSSTDTPEGQITACSESNEIVENNLTTDEESKTEEGKKQSPEELKAKEFSGSSLISEVVADMTEKEQIETVDVVLKEQEISDARKEEGAIQASENETIKDTKENENQETGKEETEKTVEDDINEETESVKENNKTTQESTNEDLKGIEMRETENSEGTETKTTGADTEKELKSGESIGEIETSKEIAETNLETTTEGKEENLEPTEKVEFEEKEIKMEKSETKLEEEVIVNAAESGKDEQTENLKETPTEGSVERDKRDTEVEILSKEESPSVNAPDTVKEKKENIPEVKTEETFDSIVIDASSQDITGESCELCGVVDVSKKETDENEKAKNDNSQEGRQIKTITTHYYNLLQVPETITKEYRVHPMTEEPPPLPISPPSEDTKPVGTLNIDSLLGEKIESEVSKTEIDDLMTPTSGYSLNLSETSMLTVSEWFLDSERRHSSVEKEETKFTTPNIIALKEEKKEVEEIIQKTVLPSNIDAVPVPPRETEEILAENTETEDIKKEDKKPEHSTSEESNDVTSESKNSMDNDVPIISVEVKTVIETQIVDDDDDEMEKTSEGINIRQTIDEDTPDVEIQVQATIDIPDDKKTEVGKTNLTEVATVVQEEYKRMESPGRSEQNSEDYCNLRDEGSEPIQSADGSQGQEGSSVDSISTASTAPTEIKRFDSEKKNFTRSSTQSLLTSQSLDSNRRKPLLKTRSLSTFRQGVTDFEIWNTIEKELEKAATTIQSKFRGYKARKMLRRENAVQIPTEESSVSTTPVESEPKENRQQSTGEFHDTIVLSVHPH